jgi:sarcosine oxidase subunit beta
MNRKTDIVVIGGGVIGASITYYLSKRGKRVTLVEKDDLAFGASGACDQMIFLQTKNPGLHLQLAMESKRIYESLGKELDHPIEFQTLGGMVLIDTEEELEVMKEFVKRQKETGLNVDLMETKDALKIQKGLSPDLVGTSYSPDDAHVNSLELIKGYIKNATRYGAEIVVNTEVTGIKTKNGKVKGVATSRGDIDCEIVVNAAGPWASLIGDMVGIKIPIKPRRGQIILTEEVPPYIKHDIISANYIAAKYNLNSKRNIDDPLMELGIGLAINQCHKGNIFIGATREFEGYKTETTREGIKRIISYAARLIPGIMDFNIIRTFAGLRPYTPDGLPIIGYVDEIEGFFMAAGHEGDGICLSPVTGKMVSDLIIDEKTFIDAERLNLSRFKRLT